MLSIKWFDLVDLPLAHFLDHGEFQVSDRLSAKLQVHNGGAFFISWIDREVLGDVLRHQDRVRGNAFSGERIQFFNEGCG